MRVEDRAIRGCYGHWRTYLSKEGMEPVTFIASPSHRLKKDFKTSQKTNNLSMKESGESRHLHKEQPNASWSKGSWPIKWIITETLSRQKRFVLKTDNRGFLEDSIPLWFPLKQSLHFTYEVQSWDSELIMVILRYLCKRRTVCMNK